MKGFILTESYNLYEQQGDYFIAWFQSKPTIEDLIKIDDIGEYQAKHILSNEGRIKDENSWYNLEEVESTN